MIITDGYRDRYIASIHRWSVYGYGEGGVWLRLGVVGYGLEWVVGGSGYFESGLQHFRARQSPATQPRRTVSDVCSYPHPGVCGLSFATISYASLSVITRMTAPNDFQGRRQKVVKRLHSGTQRRFLASTEA